MTPVVALAVLIALAAAAMFGWLVNEHEHRSRPPCPRLDLGPVGNVRRVVRVFDWERDGGV